MPDDFIDSVWGHYDHGTQRAILKLYRSAPPTCWRARVTWLREISAPALVIWGPTIQYLPTRFAHAYGEALGRSPGRDRGRRVPATGLGSTRARASVDAGVAPSELRRERLAPVLGRRARSRRST